MRRPALIILAQHGRILFTPEVELVLDLLVALAGADPAGPDPGTNSGYRS